MKEYHYYVEAVSPTGCKVGCGGPSLTIAEAKRKFHHYRKVLEGRLEIRKYEVVKSLSKTFETIHVSEGE